MALTSTDYPTMRAITLCHHVVFALTVTPLVAQVSKDPTKEKEPAFVAAKPTPLKARQSKITGLLIQELTETKLVGSTSQMNVTATESKNAANPSEVKFNQDVGPQMESALKEVKKFLSIRHTSWPKGWDMEVAFENHYNPKDGPSAAVACALLLDSLVSGAKLDEGFAVTGDLNADGAVRPVGGVPDKVRAASQKKCTGVCIPVKNVNAMVDHGVLKGPLPIAMIQIFSATTFEEASKIVSLPRDKGLDGAMTSFSEIQKAIASQPNPQLWLKHPKVVEKLKAILKAAPNHLSAKVLLDIGEGRQPATMSPLSSITAIDTEAEQLMEFIKNDAVEKAQRDQLSGAMDRLAKLRPRLDKRTQGYADSIVEYGRALRFYLDSKVSGRDGAIRLITEMRAKTAKLQAESAALRSNKDLMESMAE